MERNFTIKTIGSKKRTTLCITRKLLSLLALFLLAYNTSQASNFLDIVVTSTDVTCSGSNDGTATVTPFDAWDPITYNWSNGGTTPTITGLAPGTYEVTVIDGDGAIDIGSTVVGQGGGLDLNLNASYETCDGSSDANASVNASGGSGNYTYLWSNGETFVVNDNLSAGTYTVTVTDSNGCSAVGSIEVELSPEGVWLMTSSTDADCQLNNGTAHVTVMTGVAPFTIVWSNGDMGEDISGLSPGTYTVTVTDANGCSNTDEVTVGSSGNLMLSLNASYETCDGSNDANASVSASGGSGNYTYLWSNGETFVVNDNLSAGIYSVTVTDDNGCSAVGSIEVELSPEGVWLMTSSTDADCGLNNGTAHVSVMAGTAPFIIVWSNGDMGEDISGLSPGTYTVSVTDANGCSNTEDVVVGSGSDLNLNTSGNDAGCNASNGSANVAVMGGTAPYTFVWSNGGNTATITGLSAGTYTVTVTDVTGCSNEASITIGQEDGIDIAIIGTDADCNVNDGTATATVSGGAVPYIFNWSNGANTATITGLAPGTYTVTVTDDNGCSDTASVMIEGEGVDGGTIMTNDNLEFCVGDGVDDIVNVTLSGSIGTNSRWVITNPAGDIIGFSMGSPFNFEGAGSGSCVIRHLSYEDGIIGLTIGNNISQLQGCFDFSNTITVIRSETPTLTLTPTDGNCAGGNEGSITSNVSGGSGSYTYNWSNGATTADLFNLAAGTYTLTVTDANGCSATASATIAPIAALIINTSSTNETCVGNNDGTAMVTASGGTAPYIYAWSTGGNTAAINGLAPGTYTVTVTDDNGCSAVSGNLVIGSNGLTSCAAMVTSSYLEGVDISTFGGSDGTASASAVGGSLPYGFAWSDGQTGANAVGLSAGTYTVTVTDAGGCSCISSVTLVDPSKVGDFVWEDLDRDGLQDAGEPGIGGVTINLNGTSTSGVAVMRTVNTNPDGSYIFDGLLAGNYKLTFMEPAGFSASPLNVGTDTTIDSDLNPATGMTANFDLGIAECNLTIDAGLFQCVNIGDFVFYDGNHDGIQQPWEAGYPDAIVFLRTVGPDGVYCTPDDVEVDAKITGNDGRYLFECVEPGSYYIEFVINTAEYTFSDKDQGSNDELDSDPNSDTGKTDLFDVMEGMPDDLSYDAGVFLICDDFNNGGQICCDQEICAGIFPAPLFSVTLPGGGFGATEYIWLKSTMGGPLTNGSWMEIPNTDAPTYAPPQLYQTTYFIRCARRENCDDFVAESNPVVIVVNTCLGALIQNLNATVQAAKVKVEWNTSPEDQLLMYHVERSFDGITFEQIGEMNGFGNLQTTNHYTFMDNNPRLGRNIYRVVRENLTTQDMISSENVEVMFSRQSDRFFVYPNPVTSDLFIESLHTMNGNATLDLYDATGKLLNTLVVDYTVGKATFDFNRYAAGLYFVKVRYADTEDTDFIKVVKK